MTITAQLRWAPELLGRRIREYSAERLGSAAGLPFPIAIGRPVSVSRIFFSVSKVRNWGPSAVGQPAPAHPPAASDVAACREGGASSSASERTVAILFSCQRSRMRVFSAGSHSSNQFATTILFF